MAKLPKYVEVKRIPVEGFPRVGKDYLTEDEVNLLLGDYSKAKAELHWEPKIRFKKLVKIMAEADLNRLKNNKIIF